MQFGIRVAALGLLLSLGLAGCGGNGDGNPVNPPPGGNLELNSGTLNGGNTYQHDFMTAGTFPYHCGFHPAMQGSVTVDPNSVVMVASVSIANSTASGFQPGTVTIGVGGRVTWTNNNGSVQHTVTSH